MVCGFTASVQRPNSKFEYISKEEHAKDVDTGYGDGEYEDRGYADGESGGSGSSSGENNG